MRSTWTVIGLLLLLATGCVAADGGRGSDEPRTLALTESWRCGPHTWIGDRDGTVALAVLFAGDDASRVERGVPVKLPDSTGTWTVEVTFGENLFSNWCTDFLQEPEATISESVIIRTGTLTPTKIHKAGAPDAVGTIIVEMSGLRGESVGGSFVVPDGKTRNSLWDDEIDIPRD